jgi:hypothetical protein
MEYGVSYFQKALHNYVKPSYKINLTLTGNMMIALNNRLIAEPMVAVYMGVKNCDNRFIGNFLCRYHDILMKKGLLILLLIAIGIYYLLYDSEKYVFEKIADNVYVMHGPLDEPNAKNRGF